MENVNSGLLKCYKTKDDCSTAVTSGQDIFYNIKLKKCWTTFPSGYYLNEIDDTNHRFEIVKECEKFYYKDSTHNNNNRCTDNCKSLDQFYVKAQKNCENSCKIFSKYYYDKNNECLDTCEGKENLEYADIIDFNDDDNNIGVKPCKSSCDLDEDNNLFQHYNYGTKICLDGANCNSDKFKKNGEIKNICYNSCSEIQDWLTIFEYNSICYNNIDDITDKETNCPYYYPQDDKVKKCVSGTAGCQSANFNYIFHDQKECRNNCDDYYKFIDGTNIIKCYDNFNDAYNDNNNIKYFDIINKKCWANLPSGYYINNEHKMSDNAITYEIVENCENYYYKRADNNFACTDNCKDVNLFFAQGQRRCESECFSGFSKKYYDETNNECLDSCKGRYNLEYSDPFDNNHAQKCLNKCPNPKYFISKKDDSSDASIITNYECVDDCPTPKYIDVKTNECLESCPDSKYYIEQNGNKCYPKCDAENGYIYINNDNYECLQACPSELKKMVVLLTLDDGKKIYLCKSDCDYEENSNVFRLGDKCLDKCPQNYNFIGHNNICKSENCNEDLNGQHYYPVETINLGSNSYTIYKCINSCEDTSTFSTKYLYHTISNPNECLNFCPNPSFPYNNDYECVSKCPDDKPFFSSTTTDENYNKCGSVNFCNSGSNKYFLNGECISSCHNGGKNYIDNNNMCLDKCKDGEYREFKEENEDGTSTYICKNICDKYKYQKNINSELECVSFCPEEKNFIGADDTCKESCSQEDGINYYEMDFSTLASPPGYKIFKCVDSCPPEYKNAEANNGNQCFDDKCTENYPYLSSEEHLCYDTCLNSLENPFSLTYYGTDETTITSQICAKKCDSETEYVYFGKNKKCIKNCDELGDEKIADHDKKCVEKCNITSEYRYELDGKCVSNCDQSEIDPDGINNKKRYTIGNYKCKERCGIDEFIMSEINPNQCVLSCNNYINFMKDENGDLTGERECLPSCSKENKLYYPSRKICIDKCDNGDKVAEGLNICVSNCNEINNENKKYYLYTKDESIDDDYDKCVLNCPSNKPYIYQDECVNVCPPERKYFVKDFNQGESDAEAHKKCLSDCPSNYQYYTITQDLNGNDLYGCQDECENYYVPNNNELINAKLCLDTCPSGDYKYKYEYEENNILKKECYKVCPIKWKYYFEYTTYETNTDINCYIKCPEEAPYQKKGENICRKQTEFTGGYILYDTKEWIDSSSMTKCPNEYQLYTQTEDTNLITICLKECNYVYNNEPYSYLTPYNTCVKNCETSPLVNGKNLKNDPENKKCICQNLFYIDETSLQITCLPNSVTECPTSYPLPLLETKQCLKFCNDNRKLNPSEDACYLETTPCPENTELITKNNGQKKCECAFNFYMEGNTKVCLGEIDQCPSDKPYLVPENKECVAGCTSPYNNIFKNFCLKNCPSGTIKEGNECKCENKFWYQTSPGNYVCLEGKCLDDYPLYIGSTKQCIQSCKGTPYPDLFENKCYKDCASTGISNIEEVILDSSSLAEYKCECSRPWYYTINANHENEISCPLNDGTIQKCQDYTKANSNFKLINMISETKQCVEICPEDYPYYFNNKCYKNCDFDYNIEKVENSNKCDCQNLWYIDPNDEYEKDKICENKDKTECDTLLNEDGKNTRYLIYSNKQCVDTIDDCPPNSFKINHICYQRCPDYTLESTNEEEGNICICDKSYLWLEYKKDGNTYYECGLSKCPDDPIIDKYKRKNLYEAQNQCVQSCTDDTPEENENKFSFRNI